MGIVLSWVLQYAYAAMFGILILCGLGLPVPEEVTLLSSGLMVGWNKADFVWASVACVAGILGGDAIVFGMGHHYGQRFIDSRPMQWLLPPERRAKVDAFFAEHGSKAVFFARFFAGVRIGIYAFAGCQRMAWHRFLLLDLAGALLSGPSSIAIGMWAARAFANNPEEAAAKASLIAHQFAGWFMGAILCIIAGLVFWHRRTQKKHSQNPS